VRVVAAEEPVPAPMVEEVVEEAPVEAVPEPVMSVSPAEEAQRMIAAGNWTGVVVLGEAAVVPLIHALVDADWNVRRKAAWALEEIGDPAVDELLKVLKSPDKDVRALATEVLSKLGLETGDESEQARRLIEARQWDQVAKIGYPAVKALVHALKNADQEVRKQAVAVLGVLGDERSVEPLIGALKDGDTEVRRKAAWALGKIGDKRATGSLLEALRDEDSDVRTKTASVLDHMGWKPADESEKAAFLIAAKKWDQIAALGDAAIEPLKARLKDEDAKVREEAQWILDEIKSAKEMDALFKSLQKE